MSVIKEGQSRWRNIALISTLALTSFLTGDSPTHAIESESKSFADSQLNPALVLGLEGLLDKPSYLLLDAIRFGPSGEMAGILSQPDDESAWVAPGDNLTEFRLATEMNPSVIWLLIHNYSETADEIFDLEPGRLIFLVKNHRISIYKVDEINQFQALTPDSTQSSFINLQELTDELSASELFRRIIDTEKSEEILVLQTCIEREGLWTWGRYFVEATKIGEVELNRLIGLQVPDDVLIDGEH